MPVEETSIEKHTDLKPKLAAETLNYQLIQDDIILIEPAPVELKWDMTDKEFDEYSKAVSGILKSNKEFQDESLRRFLKRNNILVYCLKDVGRLLKYKSDNQTLYFSFLFESKRNKDLRDHLTLFEGIGIREKVFCDFIPLRVAERIRFVFSQFLELYFFISESSSSCQETFVAVTLGVNLEVFVIDMWKKNESVVRREE